MPLCSTNLMFKLSFLKIGAIASSILMEYLFDELGNREDFDVRVFSTGCKMGKSEALELAKVSAILPTDLFIIIPPNAAMEGPTTLRESVSKFRKPIIIVSDSSQKQLIEELNSSSFGYILVTADSMIGARQLFLDPVELALFNSDVLRVLAVTGVLRLIQAEIDRVIMQIKEGEDYELPRIVVDKETALRHSGLSNPYAKAKALASFEMAMRVAGLSREGTWRVKERDKYLTILASSHELMRQAALLADRAREIEKANDTVLRTPHLKNGSTKRKVKLMDTLS